MESAKSRGLRGNVGYVCAWVLWVKLLRGLRGLRGSKYFLRGSTFYVGHNFYVGCVGQIYFSCVFAWVKAFCVGSKIMYRSNFIACVSFYLLDKIILVHYNEQFRHFFRESFPSKS